ncbi:hypothetical protein HNQ77_000325 [Silvibacterium bohemicum]|uniref:Peptidase S53 domain-containing protein n=1 Tax=Silvibacterium bohemicum TaxID=1577686 RepID=A0A841JP73_9BACT|nr:Ig-like domain repeat protein [Silvibacterium bohemicum]MBB6142387.1 hypothetical protein [Silvibacterium bohemicum]
MLQKILPTLRDLRKLGAAAFLLCLAPAMLSAQATQAVTSPVANRLTQPVDESARVTLKGTVHPLANAANDRGAASDSMPLDRIQVLLQRSPAQESALKQLITDMHTPGTGSYHKWLTPDAFGKQFGPSDQDIATLEAWLQSKGFNVAKVNPGKQSLEVSGSVAQFRTAFNTQIHKYVVNGETHYANASDPQIPAALAPVFGGFASLNNFRPKSLARVLGKATYDPKTDKATPQWTQANGTGLSFVFSPADFAVQYDLTPLQTAGLEGQNQSIAIIDFSNINVALVNQFRTLFGLPANPPQVIIDGNDPGIGGINNPDGPLAGSDVESYLDVEWAGAIAPQATIDLVVAADTALENGGVLAAERAVYSNIAPIISSSISTGGCEQQAGSSNAFISALWEQAAAQGITVLEAAGDSGSAGCDNDDTQVYAVSGQAIGSWAATPYNVAVGGTDFYYSDYATGAASASTYWSTTPTQLPAVSLLQPIPEQPWNDSQYGLNAINFFSADGTTTIAAGSGGASNCALGTGTASNGGWATCTGGYPKPSWQTGAGVPADNVRDIPDLSLFAADGLNYSFFPVCAADGDCQSPSGSNPVQITGVGGTSGATPSFAGIMALVNQKYGPQGQANFVLYPLAAQFPAAFHDVTVGTNSVPCEFLPSATPGCIKVSNPITATDPNLGAAQEGQIGTGTTPEYNAGTGYDLATGLGSIDANQLVTNWGNVKFASSGVTLTSPTAGTTVTHGSPVTFTGTVAETGTGTATPTGSVAIETSSTGTSQQGQITLPLSGGAFSGPTSILPGGTYNVWARYSGDSTNTASQSAPVQITVNPEASSLNLNVLSPNSSGAYVVVPSGTASIPYGTQLVLSGRAFPTTYYNQCVNVATAPASCSTASFTSPTGTVTFSDSGTAVNTAVVNTEGDAEYNPTDPVAAHLTTQIGSHSITAAFSGDGSYSPSTAAAITYTVTPAPTTITPTAAVSTLYAGQATTFTLVIQSSGVGMAPTGTVTISGGPSGTPTSVPVASSGVDAQAGTTSSYATVAFPASVAANTYTMTFTYSGDGNYTGSSTSGGLQFVSPPSGLKASSAAITTSGPATSPDAAINVTVTVTGTGTTAPTGTITLETSGYNFNPLTLVPSTTGVTSSVTITVDSTSLLQGANVLTAAYSGDSVYAPSSSPAVSIANPLADFSLIPTATTLTIPSSGTVPDTVNISSVNGFSGAVNLACASAGGVECVFSNASPVLTAGGSAAVAVTVNNDNVTTAGTYNLLITGTDSTGAYVHTLGLSVIAPATTLLPGLALSGPAGIAIQNPGDTATASLTVLPQGGLTGVTSISCTVTNSPAGVTCSAPATAANGTSSTLTVTTTSATPPGTYTAELVATQGNTTSATLPIPIIVSPALAIALSGTAPAAISPGASATSTISVAPAGGFTGTVNLSCSITTSPSGANDVPTCSIASSVSVTAAAAVTTPLTVNTTAATTSSLDRPLNKFFAVGGGIAVAGLLLFSIPARRRSWRSILGVLVFAAVVGLGIGCGGSGSSSGGGGGGTTNPGTTAGTYMVTVTGADASTGKITNSTTVSVTVN